MCMMLYIGCDAPLELVPWDAARPGFHLAVLNQNREVRQQFGVPHVYYAGSHEGCGCGFQLGEYPEIDDEDAPRKRETLQSLASYLDAQLSLGRSIELFACWSGGEAEVPEQRRAVSTAELRAEQFYFHDGEHVTVHAPHSPTLQPTAGVSARG